MKALVLSTLAVLGLAATANASPTERTLTDLSGAHLGRLAMQEDLPGWTGRTFVRGSHSTIAGDADATRWAQTGQV